MKKSMIAAGAASLALAAMPVLGAFALNGSQTDTLIVTISDSCTIDRGTGTNGHTNGTGDNAGTWGTDSSAAEATAGHYDTLSGTIPNGGTAANFGKSNFRVECNNANGWKVTAGPVTDGNLNLTATSGTIPNGTANAQGSSWSFTPDNNSDTTFNVGAANATKVAWQAGQTGVAGKSFDVTYSVTVGGTQPAGVYTGRIVYTLAETSE